MPKINTVEEYIKVHPKWENQLNLLREILTSYPLTEGIKWGVPVYEMDGKNLFSLGAFKNHYAIWFFQGGLLKENTSLLSNAQEGKTKAMRQMRFDESSKIDKEELSKYIEESIYLHKQGKTIKPLLNQKFKIPSELEELFISDRELKESFLNLSPGKQREFSEHISLAKKEETKLNRLERIVPLIKEGKGLNDKYKRS